MIPAAHSQFEQEQWNKGYNYVVGIDEVGRGCWAGPAVIGAVIFPKDCLLSFQLADSKKLSPKKRQALVPLIKSAALCHALYEVTLQEINELGVGKAIQNGFAQIVKILSYLPDFVLIDAFKIKEYPSEKQKAIIKGDEQSISIAAASILAKEHRDALMKSVHLSEPRYNFAHNVGYGTKEHRDALAKHGLSAHHRTSFDLTKWYEQESTSA
jgi:ribonuclease HII